MFMVACIFRAMLSTLLIVATPQCVLAQTKSEQGNAPPSTIDINDLQGVTIDATIVYRGRSRNLRTRSEDSGVKRERWRIVIGPGLSINWRVSETNQLDTGNTTRRTSSMSGTIGRPQTGSEINGARVWTIESNTLILLRVYHVGGEIKKFSLTRSSAGFDCTLRGYPAREVGTDHIIATGTSGDKVEILEGHQVSSTCRISKGG